MYLKSKMLYIYVETPLHAGAGTGIGAVDLPIQRERATDYPLIQSSGIKGALREAARDKLLDETLDADKMETAKCRIRCIFGPDGDNASEHAGAVAPGDARILLFPVRSLKGVFVWTTSLDALRRWRREAEAAGFKNLPELPPIEPPHPENGTSHCYVSGAGAVADKTVVLEEFAYTVDDDPKGKNGKGITSELANWLANNTLPTNEEYKWWGNEMSQKLVVLPNDDFRDFLKHATEVLTRIRLNPDVKTVVPGALWTEEHLPPDTLLYAPVRATRFRATQDKLPKDWAGIKDPKEKAATVLTWVSTNITGRLQLGGDETVGRGIVSLRWTGGDQ